MPKPTTIGLINARNPAISGNRLGDNSKDLMCELFNDFKRLNVQDKNAAKDCSKAHISHVDLSAANDENRKPMSIKGQSPKTKTKQSALTGLNHNSRSESKLSSDWAHKSRDNEGPHSTKDALSLSNYNQTYESNTTVTLYVGDLDKSVTETMLSSLFKNYNSFLSAKLCYSPTTRSSLGYGYVNFSSAEDASKATEDLNYTVVSNKEIRIMPYVKGKDKSFMSTNVFVSNLNTDHLTLRSFYEKFKHAGNILSCKLDVRKRQGFISFESKFIAEQFVKDYNTASIDGSNIHCSIHIPKSMRNSSCGHNDTEDTKSHEYSSPSNSCNIYTGDLNTEESTKPVTESVTRPKMDSGQISNHSIEPENSNIEDFNQVYIKGLPITVTDSEIDSIFEPFGRIIDIYKETVASFKSTWCFVTFENHQSAVDAIENCHKISYKGKKITCVKALKKAERQKLLSSKPTYGSLSNATDASQPHKTKADSLQGDDRQKNSNTKLFIYNLPHSVNENFFKLFLRSYSLDGKVTKYSFQRASKENYIEFEKKSDAVTIHQKLNGVNLSGLLIQTSLIQLDDGVKNQASGKTKTQPVAFMNSKPQNLIDPTLEVGSFHQGQQQQLLSQQQMQMLSDHTQQLSTNFHPMNLPNRFYSGPGSPSSPKFQVPSASTFGSITSVLNSIPSLSTSSTIELISPQPSGHITNEDLQKTTKAPYHVNTDLPFKYEKKEVNGPLSYQDLYSSSYETKLSKALQRDIERLALHHIDFLSYPSATRTANLKKILNYLFMTFWGNSTDDVVTFFKAIEKHPDHVHLFKGRLIAAVKILGYER